MTTAISKQLLFAVLRGDTSTPLLHLIANLQSSIQFRRLTLNAKSANIRHVIPRRAFSARQPISLSVVNSLFVRVFAGLI